MFQKDVMLQLQPQNYNCSMEEHLVEVFLQQKLVIKMQQKWFVEKTQKRVP